MTQSPRRTLGIGGLVLINLAIIYSVRGLPMLAEEGLAVGFFLLLSVVFFMIPAAFISAELATGWPPHGPGGIYVWAREAFGERWGFVAIWMQWAENVIWFPTVLSFIGATIAFIFLPEMADNKVFLLTTILVIYWAGTLANLRGIRTSTWISGVGVAGTLIVSALIIGLGVVWIVQGRPISIEVSAAAFVPDLSDLHALVFLAGILVITSGIEVSAVHAGDVRSPARTFPAAILLSCVVSFVALLLGGLAIAIVVPVEQLSLTAGLMDAFAAFFRAYHVEWLVPVVAGLVVLGSIGEVAAWIIGPSRGLLVTARDGVLPPFFQKVNRANAPVNILLVQAVAVTALVLLFLFMPTVNSVYWILTALTAQLYLVMYVFLFLAGLVLRYRQPGTHRGFRVPGGLFGMWFFSVLGVSGCLFTFALGFVPPAHVDSGSLLFFESFLGLGVIAMTAVPLILYQIRKPHWRKEIPEQ
jgi:putative glutamate/gamma-aminobutyrate antiporter